MNNSGLNSMYVNLKAMAHLIKILRKYGVKVKFYTERKSNRSLCYVSVKKVLVVF